LVTPERMIEIEQHARRFGPANGWTGTSGTLSSMIIELLKVIRELEAQKVGTLTEVDENELR
jgi:hypothetical protein